MSANLGDTTGALESYSKAQALLERQWARYPNDEALENDLRQASMSLSEIPGRQGKADAAIANARRAIALAERLSGLDPRNPVYRENLAHAYTSLGHAQLAGARQTSSFEAFQAVLESNRKALAVQEAAGPDAGVLGLGRLSSCYFKRWLFLKDLGRPHQ